MLDDTEYKPGGAHRQQVITRPPIGQLGDIFDITVSAIQGPGGSSSAGQGKPYVIPGMFITFFILHLKLFCFYSGYRKWKWRWKC